MRQKSLFDGTSVSIFCFFCTRPDLSAEKSFLFMSILSKRLHPTIGLCVRTFSNNAFSVQHGLFQGVAVIHQLEGKVGVFFLQQTEKELVPLPDGQFLHLRLLHPLQFALGAGIAPDHLALPPVGSVQMDELIRINRITISAGTSGLLLSFCSAAVSCIMPQKASFLKTFCHKLPDFT